MKHPNVAHIYEIDEAEGEMFITMELVEGETLSDILVAGPLPVDRALPIATELAEGLAAAHARGMIHRDLKPGNIMLTRDGHPKIIDFGLVKPISAQGTVSAARTRGLRRR